MILYLTSEDNNNLLDFLDKSDTSQPVKKMIGEYQLKQFVVSDMRNFTHFNHVILDRIAFIDSDIEFLEGLKEFFTMYSAKISIIDENLKKTDKNFQEYLEIGICNLITSNEIETIQEEILECISDKGMTKYNEVDKKTSKIEIQEKYEFSCKNISIGVVSSQNRIGCTTLSIGISNYFAQVGAEIAYINEDKEKLETILLEIEENKKNNNLEYCCNKPLEYKNFLIYDIGTKPFNMEEFDILIGVCGIKYYELPFTSNLILNVLKDKKSYICPNFVVKEKEEEILELLKSGEKTVLFLKYQPSLIDTKSNEMLYKSILKECYSKYN